MATAEVGDLNTLFVTKLKQLHGLAISIGVERSRGNEAGVQALRTVFVQVASDMNVIAAKIYADETQLDWVERFLTQLDSGVRTLTTIPNDLFKLSGLKPLLYIGLGILALHYLSPLFKLAGRGRE